MTCSRLLMAYIVTVLVGLVVSRLRADRVLRDHVLAEGATEHSHARGSHDQRVTHALRVARIDFLDTAMYFVIGVMITSVFNTRLVVLVDLPCRVHAKAVVRDEFVPDTNDGQPPGIIYPAPDGIKDRVSILHQVTMTSRSVPVTPCTCSR